MWNAAKSSISSDFFTPISSSVKGKEKAWSNECRRAQLSQSQEWSCFSRYPFLGSAKTRSFIRCQEIAKAKRSSRRLPLHAGFRQQPRASSRLQSKGSRRNASTSLDTLRAAGLEDDDPAVNESGIPGDAYEELKGPATSSLDLPPELGEEERWIFRKLVEVIEGERDYYSQVDSWDLFQRATDADLMQYLSPWDELRFALRLAIQAEARYQSPFPLDTLHQQGRQLKSLIVGLAVHFVVPKFNIFRLCLLARAMALCGEIHPAAALLRRLCSRDSRRWQEESFLYAYKGLILSIHRHESPLRVLEFAVEEWSSFGSHTTLTGHSSFLPTSDKIPTARSTLYKILATIHDFKAALSHAAQDGREKRYRTRMGKLLTSAFIAESAPTQGLIVVEELRRQGVQTETEMLLILVRALVKEDALGPARSLLASVPKSDTQGYASTCLYFYAHVGDYKRAQALYDDMSSKELLEEGSPAMLLQAYATAGRKDDTRAVFDKFFPVGLDGTRGNPPSLMHFNIMLHAYAKAGDIDAIHSWLTEITKNGHHPNVYVYTTILNAFAIRGDIESLSVVLDQMERAGHKPNQVTYNQIITLLANRRDPVAAETVYKRALQEGVVPNRRMVTALMNAHVKAGSWRGVIRVFDYMRRSPLPDIRLTIEVYNTLLTAYVSIGAPFAVVSKLFAKLEDLSISPDKYTFALLLQSACDAGHMNIATEILAEMEKVARNPASHIEVDVVVLTIIMAGFLRQGDRQRAKVIYDDMLSRGIEPSAASFNAILKSYTNERTEESLRLAEQFIQSLLRDSGPARFWDVPANSYPSALDQIYAPVMHAYANMNKPEEVERVFEEYLQAGGEPSLGRLTSLLDAYRRSFNSEAAMQLWPQIFHLGLKHANDSKLLDPQGKQDASSKPRFRANILTVPLSIYIDILSASGHHAEIGAVWKQFQVNKLVFDSHNWNHLAVALVRAGEAERAFQVVDRVILPYQKRSREMMMSREPTPESPLVFDEDVPQTSDADKPLPQSATKGTLREHAVSRHKFQFKNLSEEMDGLNKDDFFVHPLRILHSISPAWNIWAPHNATLNVLGSVLSHLQSGAPLDPVMSPNDPRQYEQELPEDAEPRRERARDTLDRIYQNYPTTIQLVQEYQDRVASRREQS